MLAEEAAALVESQVARAAAGAGLSKGVVNALTTAAGNAAHSAVTSGVGYATKKRKVDSDAIKTEKTFDPQNHNTFSKSKNLPIGAVALFRGAEKVDSSLRLSIRKPVFLDPLKAYLQEFTRSRRMHMQFGLQYTGDDQQRSLHGLIFRHRLAVGDVSRVLKPTVTFKFPVVNGVQTNIPFNFFDASPGINDNGKVMVSPYCMGDLEELAATLTPYHANKLGDLGYNQTSTSAGPSINAPPAWGSGGFLTAQATWAQQYCLKRYDTTVGPTSFRAPIIVVGIKTGGVKLYFENKHPVGSFVEVIVYKVRSDYAETLSVSYTSGAPDSPIAELEESRGRAYVDKASRNRNVNNGFGRVPLKTDVSFNPYFPLLPDDNLTGGVSFEGPVKNYWSEKQRIKFAVASGHKRNVHVSFGGIKYDPANVGADNGQLVMVCIAINGQMISAYATSGVDSLISGDVCAGHNMVIRGEYYEQVYPLKITTPAAIHSQMDMEPTIPSPPVSVTYNAYQILDPNSTQRAATSDVAAGTKYVMSDGNKSNDVIG